LITSENRSAFAQLTLHQIGDEREFIDRLLRIGIGNPG